MKRLPNGNFIPLAMDKKSTSPWLALRNPVFCRLWLASVLSGTFVSAQDVSGDRGCFAVAGSLCCTPCAWGADRCDQHEFRACVHLRLSDWNCLWGPGLGGYRHRHRQQRRASLGGYTGRSASEPLRNRRSFSRRFPPAMAWRTASHLDQCADASIQKSMHLHSFGFSGRTFGNTGRDRFL
jgi:hypothetical protein